MESVATSPTSSVAAQVRAELARHRVSGRELARQTGLDPQYWWRRLSGKTPLNVEDLVQVAAVLNVPVSALVAPLDGPGNDSAPMVE
nr:helix-turn-helix transcriptional regulator [Sphaerisporangium cinnabarinum]